MGRLIINIVSLVFVRPVFVLVLPRSPAMKKCVFFCLAISCRRKRKIPAAMPRGRCLPQNRQKEKATHLRGFCCHAWPFLLPFWPRKRNLFFPGKSKNIFIRKCLPHKKAETTSSSFCSRSRRNYSILPIFEYPPTNRTSICVADSTVTCSTTLRINSSL